MKAYGRRALPSHFCKVVVANGWLGIFCRKVELLESTGSKLPHDIKIDWLLSRDSLHELEQLQIPPCVVPSEFMEEFQLNLFTAARQMAEAGNVKSRIKSKDGPFSYRLLVANTKVALVKTGSLHRLELCGAQRGARLMQTISVFAVN